MKWVKEEFYDFIIKNGVIGIFDKPLKLKSGRFSFWYINWRNISEDVYLLDKLTDFLISFIGYLNLKPDCFYGVPEGASKLGIIAQYKWAKNQENYGPRVYKLSMGRGKPKDHGDPKDEFFLGIPKGKVIILEDVTTTGESLINTIRKLHELDVEIIAAIGLSDRNELRDDGKSVPELIKEEGTNYVAMSNALDLLPKLKPSSSIAKKIEDYFKKYGIKEINLP